MKLQEYLEEEGMTGKEFAIKAGLSYTGVLRFLNPPHPQRKTASKIVKATEGKVTLKDLGFDFL